MVIFNSYVKLSEGNIWYYIALGYNISDRNQLRWAQASDLPDPELSDEGRPTVPWVPWVAKI